MPIGGRMADEWAPIAISFLVGRLRGGHELRYIPVSAAAADVTEVAAPLAGLVMLAGTVTGGRAIGVLKDERAGTYTAVAAVAGRTFALLDPSDKDRRVAAWGGVLVALARAGT